MLTKAAPDAGGSIAETDELYCAPGAGTSPTLGGTPRSGEPDNGGAEARQLVRRLDWRFLLPDPRLRRVAYLGPDGCLLARALEAFSDSLRVFAGDGPEREVTDVLVAHAARWSDIDAAAAGLVPGGMLYWEMARGRDRLGTNPVAWLKQRGFTDIQTHWHYPGFETCRQIVPLDDAAACASLLREHFASVDRAVLLAFSRWLTWPTLVWRLAAPTSVVARKPRLVTP